MLSSQIPIPEHFSRGEAFACFRPQAEVTLDEAVEMIDSAIGYCRTNDIRSLLVNITGLTGFPPPSTTDRFFLIEKWVKTAAGKVVISMVARPEIIDPNKIGVLVANNRGMKADIFTDESEATAWLVKNMPAKR